MPTISSKEHKNDCVLPSPVSPKRNHPIKDPSCISSSLSKHTSFSCSANLASPDSFHEYLQILIELGEIPDNVLTVASIYFKRCFKGKKAMKQVKPAGIKVLYGVCVFLAYKFLIEIDFWPLEEFCLMVGVKKRTLFKYEVFVVSKLLNFNLFASLEEYT